MAWFLKAELSIVICSKDVRWLGNRFGEMLQIIGGDSVFGFVSGHFGHVTGYLNKNSG